jgi:hypothetical protein
MIADTCAGREDHHHDQRDASSSSNCTSCTEARMVTVRSVSTSPRPRRQRRLQLRQQLLHAVDDLDHVGAGLALDVDDDRRRVVRPRRELAFSAPSTTVGDVGSAPARRCGTR